jgi:hypothetical protein
VWRSLVARFVRDEEAVGSNPATPTNKSGGLRADPSHRAGLVQLQKYSGLPLRSKRCAASLLNRVESMTAISNGICIRMSTRLGGDEFAIAFVEGDTTFNATQVAER